VLDAVYDDYGGLIGYANVTRDITEQSLVVDVGLPGRNWYKNLIYAPGRYTGYAPKTLPGVREAIEEERWTDVDRYAALTGAALDAYADRLDQSARLMGDAGSVEQEQ
jgi:hypothetical protein